MKVASAVCLLLIAAAPSLAADALPATHSFSKRLPNSERRVAITEATFDDEFCFRVTGFASDGEHVAEIAVFDASGREVARVVRTVFAQGAKWIASFCPSATKDQDVPGEWWFTATLDENLVASASMMVTYGKPKVAGPAVSPAVKPEPEGYPRARKVTPKQ